jgi:hypothetical protein
MLRKFAIALLAGATLATGLVLTPTEASAWGWRRPYYVGYYGWGWRPYYTWGRPYYAYYGWGWRRPYYAYYGWGWRRPHYAYYGWRPRVLAYGW